MRPLQSGANPIRRKASGGIAQLVEQLTLNQLVLGSSPSAPTNEFKRLGQFSRTGLFAFGRLVAVWLPFVWPYELDSDRPLKAAPRGQYGIERQPRHERADTLLPQEAKRVDEPHDLEKLAQEMGFGGVMDIHGLRAMASIWANDKGRYRPDVIGVALAHKEADRARAGYNRAEFVGELKKLWQDWADFCDSKLREHIANSDRSHRQAA